MGRWPQPYLSIVVPVYRSAECLDALAAEISAVLCPLGHDYQLILVNDGSPDNSWNVIENLCHSHANIIGVNLRRNFGQDNAILTGLRMASGKFVVIMDDDLQHDPADLPALLGKIGDGADVVYADFRKKRQRFWKNWGSWFNGKVAEWVIDKPRGVYLSPYKIITQEVARLICNYDGPDPYVDGLLFQVTSSIDHVSAEHRPRYAGRSTYTLWKSLRVLGRLAFSFSIKPLRLVSLSGFAFAGLGLVLALVVIFYRLFFPEDFPPVAVGWASLMVALLVIAGLQMIFFGVLGEYAGRTYLKVNNKPQSAIREVINAKNPGTSLIEEETEFANKPNL